MPRLGITETIQRVGLLDLTSITERTIPVTGNPAASLSSFRPGIGRSGNVELLPDS
jgi:hypothetical protein